ncbi:hypothetical protein FRC12_010725 [Ceratobasidium sp. 428]|nr:hypothetical protein FRC12_010725 [Ceratobasidium sp. 428]
MLDIVRDPERITRGRASQRTHAVTHSLTTPSSGLAISASVRTRLAKFLATVGLRPEIDDLAGHPLDNGRQSGVTYGIIVPRPTARTASVYLWALHCADEFGF